LETNSRQSGQVRLSSSVKVNKQFLFYFWGENILDLDRKSKIWHDTIRR
jgi:hypothetical protein